ncbi:MAG: imidazoleglycerol-phosphate dehydratase HisB [Spirochaetota bacterium]|nr:imidazoleglycerol-phosphate dehydratase HisB [Spirochaetota bacterium]
MKKKSEIKRKTLETDIVLNLILNNVDKSIINTGMPFFDHMLGAMARHGRFFLDLNCKGDYEIDGHHSVEDIGICLGKAFKDAIGSGAGIKRFGDAIIPMDDALTMVAIDFSGRSYFSYIGPRLDGYINGYSEELTQEFLRSFATNAAMNIHVIVLYGENRHHIQESIFKALGVSLSKACSGDPLLGDSVPSTKGIIV